MSTTIKPHLPQITASSMEEFKSIEEAINKLPKNIVEQIEIVSSGALGIECTFDKYKSYEGCIIPKTTRQISDFEDYYGVYAEGYFFTIPKNKHSKKMPTFTFE